MDCACSMDEEAKEGTYLVGNLSANTYFEERSNDIKIISKLMLFGGVCLRGMN
jgi:hypothetical protein